MRPKAFLSKCSTIEKRLNKILDYAKEINDSHGVDKKTIQKVKSLYEEAKGKNLDLSNSLNAFFESLEDDIDQVDIDAKTSSIFDLFIEIEVLLKPIIDNNKTNQGTDISGVTNSIEANNVPQIRLPKLQLKQFNGERSQWTAYYNLFNTSVHNHVSFSNVEKFQYLLSTLNGEPLNLIKSLPLTTENYQIAYDTIVERYHNPRLLKSVHVNFIIDMPNCTDTSAHSLRNFISNYKEHSSALSALNYDMDSDNLFLITILLRKFPTQFRTRFEAKREHVEDFPSPKEFISFLENECLVLENAMLSHDRVQFFQQKGESSRAFLNKPMKNISHFSNNDKTDLKCEFCLQNGHVFYKCTEFLHKNQQERYDFIKSKKLCINCFGLHKTYTCCSTNSCKFCHKRHNSLLHKNTIDAPKSKSNTFYYSNDNKNCHHNRVPQGQQYYQESNSDVFDKNKNEQTLLNSTYNTNHSSPQSYTTLLGTAMIKLSVPNGRTIVARALIDSGSSCTIINEYLANQLAVKRSFAQNMSQLNGISSVSVQTKGKANVNISTMDNEIVSENHPVLILSKLTSNLPCSTVPSEIVNKLTNFKLADPTFYKPGLIQVLLGADIFVNILKESKYSLGKDMPYAVDSSLGFIVMGNISTRELNKSKNSTFTMPCLLTITEDPLHKCITKFWESEQPPTSKHLNLSDVKCENHFIETVSRKKSGEYVVSLPFKDDPKTNLGQSSEIAKKRFFSLEKRLNSQPEYKKMYCDFMKDYLETGHMKLFDITKNNLSNISPHYFIPHHGVFKDNSSTTKLRVVFDASTATSSGKSLNDILHSGPKLHNDIASIIVNFRRYNFVFTTDIKQMFRSIDLDSNDHQFQMIYWREDPMLPLSIYKLQTVTYGMTSSPFLANRTIIQLIEDEGRNHLVAAKALKTQIYVDDVVLGADVLEDAIVLLNDVNELFKKGGFNLRKWTANHEDLLRNIPKEYHEKPVYFRTPEQPLVSVLGLQWLPNTDCFSYRIQVTQNEINTKRTVLQNISSVYDPCGFLAPVVFFGKQFIQELWIAGLDWDTPLPNHLNKKWNNFIIDLPNLETIVYERCLLLANTVDVQLHGFSDSSPKGMAACVYLRTVNSHGEINIRLIIAKTRVAPLKHTSLPRLELCAAYLLSDLLDFCVKNLELQETLSSITAWSDSTVTLSWIKTPSFRLKLFVANRVAHIQETIPAEFWRYVPSNKNPIDCATRGMYPSEFMANKEWFNGPTWLYSSSDSWPKYKLSNEEQIIPEIKTNILNTCNVVSSHQEWDLLNKFSSWTKLCRIVSYILRFKNNLKSSNKIKCLLTTNELKASENLIIQHVQKGSFHEDMKSLSKNKSCSQRLLRLSPFIDEHGILRVGGRLKHAPVHYEVRHPIILPKNHHVTRLIIEYYHLKYLHAGPQLVQSLISQKFWILSSRSAIRLQLFKCNTCYRYKPHILQPKMGNLPESRLTPSPAFKTTGCDYAGPFDVKIHTLRRAQVIKAYICLFVCFVTKAVHIEVTTDLSASTYMAALTRFVSRRGLSSDIHLDNATNFVGTSNRLKKTINELFNSSDMRKLLNQYSLDNSVKFHFIPPTASHMGGLWERSVRSIKHHLYKVVKQQILTLEEFQTLAVRIEAVLNSRPLCPLSSDPNELDILTPAHFLIGRSMVALPEEDIKDVPLNHLKRWQRVQSMTQYIWNKWQKEVLQNLQQRQKWTKDEPNIKEGDIVLIHESNVPPQMWCLGRVEETVAGDDGCVRVVKLKTAKGTFTRPVVKVSPLPHSLLSESPTVIHGGGNVTYTHQTV